MDGSFTGYDGFASFSGNFLGYAPPAKLQSGGAYIHAATVVADFNFGNAFILASNPGYNAALSAVEAYQIDSKIDDGLPFTGNVLYDYGYSGPRVQNAPAVPPGCTVNGLNLYDTQAIWYNGAPDTSHDANRIECIIAIKAAW